MMLLYCRSCFWRYPGDATGVGIANRCPECGERGLRFIKTEAGETDSYAELRFLQIVGKALQANAREQNRLSKKLEKLDKYG